MLVVAAVVVALNAVVPAAPRHDLPITESVRHYTPADAFVGPRFHDETRLGLGWKLAPVAAQLVDAWSTQRHLNRFGRDRAWPAGEINPLMRPLAHSGGLRWYAAKAAFGVGQAFAINRVAKLHGSGKAKRFALLLTAASVSLATSNSVQIAFTR